MQGTNRRGEGGEGYGTPDLSCDKEGEKRRAKIINGMGKKKDY